VTLRSARASAAGAAILIMVRVAGIHAQESDPHAAMPERPTVATHAGTVAPGWLEVETGVEVDRFEDRTHGGLVPTTVKLGLVRAVQLTVQAPVIKPAGGSFGIGDWSAGAKWRFASDLPLAGDVAILPSVKLPTGSVESQAGTGTTDASLLLISSHAFGPVSMDMNVGLTRRSGNGSVAPRRASVWTVSFGGPLRDAVGWTVECFGYPGTSGPAGERAIIAILGGPTLRLHPWLVADAGVIVPVRGPEPRAVYAGLVYNIGRVW
jgi:hypothetical protein